MVPGRDQVWAMTKTAGEGAITGDYEIRYNSRSGAITAFQLPDRLRNRLWRLRISRNRWSNDYGSNYGDYAHPDYVFPLPFIGEGNVRGWSRIIPSRHVFGTHNERKSRMTSTAGNAAYVRRLCKDCHERPHSPGRPRCEECHAAYWAELQRGSP